VRRFHEMNPHAINRFLTKLDGAGARPSPVSSTPIGSVSFGPVGRFSQSRALAQRRNKTRALSLIPATQDNFGTCGLPDFLAQFQYLNIAFAK
jgi:hypothetical protein